VNHLASEANQAQQQQQQRQQQQQESFHLTSLQQQSCTARHNTENSKQIFPEKELRGHSPTPTFMFL
jgi:hypothetical protein